MSNYNPYQTPESGLALETAADLEYDTTPVYSPSGRMGRVSYIAWSSLAYIVFILAMFLGLMIFGQEDSGPDAFWGVYGVLLIPFAVIFTIFGIRRLHDMDRSGWQYIMVIIPLVNIYITLVMLLQAGTPGENSFGGPRQTQPWEKIVAIVGLIFFILVVLTPVLIPMFLGASV